MKTLKKSLCLVLALVFVLGLCTVGVGAFNDDADINKTYAEAINVMSDLGIITGYPDGSFQPGKEVTRAEAATLVARMVLGEDAKKLPKSCPFPDVNPEVGYYDWAVGSIGYCYTMGWINGYPDGTYKPEAPIKCIDLAKVLLCALGYGKNLEFTGPGYDTVVFIKGLEAEIFEDTLQENGENAVRGETAQYIFNAMDTSQVTYSKDSGEYTPNGKTYAKDKWKLSTEIGIVLANPSSDPTIKNTMVELKSGTFFFSYATGLEDIGAQVQIRYKDAASAKDAEPTKVYSLETVSHEDTPKDISKLQAASTMYSWANYVSTKETVIPADKTLIIGEDGKVVGIKEAEEFYIRKITDNANGKVTLDDGTVIDLKTNTDAAKNTWNLVDTTKGAYIETIKIGTAIYATRATSKYENIQFTGRNNTAPYKYNGKYAQSAAKNVSTLAPTGALALGKAYTLYMDSNDNYFAIEVYTPTEAPQQTAAVFFVKAFSLTGEASEDAWGNPIPASVEHYAQCVTADGEPVKYKTGTSSITYAADGSKVITLVSGNDYSKNASMTRGAYILGFNPKTSDAELTAPTAQQVDAAQKGADWSKAAINKIPGKAYYLSDKTTVIVVAPAKAKDADGNDLAAELGNLKVTTTTGPIQGNYTGKAMYIALPDTTSAVKNIQTIWIDGAEVVAPLIPETVAGSYIYVTGTKSNGQTLIGEGTAAKEYATYSVYIDGVKKTVALADAPTAGFFTYTEANGLYTLTAINTTLIKKATITLDGTAELIYEGMFTSTDPDFEGKTVTGLAVCDLRTDTSVVKITDVAGLNGAKNVTLTVLMPYIYGTTNTSAPVGVIYITG